MVPAQLFSLLFISLLYHSCESFTVNQLIYPGQNEYFELSIAHINDFHARFERTSYTSGTCHKDDERNCIAGLARVATSARQLLEEQPNAIFLNAGDFYQGTLWYNMYKWKPMVHFMNMLPHDVVTIGNHDFDDDIAGIVPFLKQLKAPIVVTNINDSQEPKIQTAGQIVVDIHVISDVVELINGLYRNSTIIVRDNQKIGVIGVITKTTNTISQTGKLRFLDEIETVNAEAARLKAQGVKIIIVLSHCGIREDRKLAANCPDVDVVVGGHSHTFLYSGRPPFIDVPVDTYPVVVKQNTGRTVLIVQAQAFTRYMGNLTVWFNRQGEVVDWQGNPILLDHTVEEDPKILQELKPWQEAVQIQGEQVIGETRSFLNSSCRAGECNLANLITDAMVYPYQGKAENPKYWTKIALACTNAGGIRASIPAGSITYGDVVTIDPFQNTWDTVEIKGEDLLLAIEESVSKIRETDWHIGAPLLHWSGVKVVFNLTRPAYSRVQYLRLRCQACERPVFEKLKKNYWYRLVVQSFIVRGGDALSVIARKHRNHQVGKIDIDQLIDYIKAITPFDYKIENRMTILTDWKGRLA